MQFKRSLGHNIEVALIQNGGVIRDSEAMATPDIKRHRCRNIDGRCLPER